MEHLAVALNPRQGLIAGARLHDVLAATPGQEQVLALLEERLNAARFAVYRVRRALLPSSRRPDRAGTSARDLRAVATGDRAAMGQALAQLALEHRSQLDLSDPRHPRVWLQCRGPYLPATESYFAIAPHVAVDKTAPSFAAAWAKATTTAPTAPLVIRLRGDLRARLELVCQLTGHTLQTAVTQALDDWVTERETDPDLRDQALARLEAEERALAERRHALAALTKDKPPWPGSASRHDNDPKE